MTRATSTTDRVVEAATALWPAPTRISIDRRTLGWRHRVSGTDLMFVPSAAAPRLLVPRDNRAASRALWRFSAALTPRERATRVLAAGALRAGARLVPADVLRLAHHASSSITDYLGAALGTDVVVAFGVGNPRANQKPVLHVFDRAGRSIAFAKIGDTAVTRRLVEQEERSLRRLGARSFDRLRVPEVLHAGDWQGVRVLVLTALPSGPLGGARRTAVLLRDAMRELAECEGTTSTALASSAFWSRQRALVAAVADPTARGRFAEALDAVEQTYGGRELLMGSWHGDWTPWNMCRWRGFLHLWDWERHEPDVPVGFDHAHYRVNTIGRRAAGLHPHAVADALQDTPGCVALLYLVSITGRYLIGSQAGDGESARADAAALLDALCGQVSTQVRSPR